MTDEKMITQEQLKMLLPMACEWTEEQEGIITRRGVPLSTVQIADALEIGVEHPEKVRLLKVARIPFPTRRDLCSPADVTRLMSPLAAGLTVRYGIFIRADCWDDRRVVCHELCHTAQYERLGGLQQFLKQYLYECFTIGYPEAPMEQEAVAVTAKLCVT
jgi:hypothetical protein